MNEQNISDDQPPRIVSKPEERIKSLIGLTDHLDVDNATPVKRYLRSGRELLRMGKIYLDEHNLEKSFIMYMKYIILFIEQLPKHADYNTIDAIERKQVISNCNKVIPLAEDIKSKIKKRYQKEYEDYLTQKKIYERKLKEKEELLQKQRDKKKAELTNKYVNSFQSQLDQKKQELFERKQFNNKQKDLDEISDNDVEKDASSLESSDNEDVPSNSLSSLTIESKSIKPVVDRRTKPNNLISDVNKNYLSELVVPFKSITRQFSQISELNTSRNVETCAILAGELSHNIFTITHLMVPKQSGTSDSCSAMNEEEIAFEQEKLQLITLGWIHTHPSQRSFLSSIDLHTHAPYQKMLPEAIAIVVAPSAGEICMYSLTEHGLEYILRCRQSGFHPHQNENSLYSQAGHVRVDDSLQVDVVDCR